MLREAKNTGKFFKHVGSIYSTSEARNGASSAYRILSEDEIEAVSLMVLLKVSLWFCQYHALFIHHP